MCTLRMNPDPDERKIARLRTRIRDLEVSVGLRNAQHKIMDDSLQAAQEKIKELEADKKSRISFAVDLGNQAYKDLQAANEKCAKYESALRDVVTQFPLVYGDPVPAWIRNAQAALQADEEGK